MAQEIEKKYLVFKDKLPKLEGGTLYVQGYLCLSPLIRFRIIGNDVCLNLKKIKSDSSIREEWEFYNTLSDNEIKKLVELSLKQPVKKIRYKINYKNLVWEIDEYQEENSGLITTEVELQNENDIIYFPEWVDSNYEISNDEKYFNRNLGDYPYKLFRKDL